MSAPRFGVWGLTSGAWGSFNHPTEKPDASFERNRAMIVEAEALGYDCTLLAQHTIAVRGDHLPVLEPWTTAAALAAVTEKIELIVAIKPFLYHPVLLSKMALQIEEISRGRAAINVVNGWFQAEAVKAGIPFFEHDQRYAYGEEWLAAVEQLTSGGRVTVDGAHFTIDDYVLRPASAYRKRPAIYLGGESEPARDLAAKLADTFFLNAQPLDSVERNVADMRARTSRDLGFAMSSFVIARETEEEAQAALQDALSYAALDAELDAHTRANTDSSVVMFKTMPTDLSVGTNGGVASGLVGSYDQVAERINAFHRAGVGTFMLQFQPFEDEMRRFAGEVAPRVRALAEVSA